jgi:hypothetical protein
MPRTENQLAVELIRYYQQKKALKLKKDSYNNTKQYLLLMRFYDEKIKEFRRQLQIRNPERLQEIDAKADNVPTTEEAESNTIRSGEDAR